MESKTKSKRLDEKPEIASEEDFVMPTQKRCDTCIHSPVCGAYAKIQGAIISFEEQFTYINEFPAKAIALATMCEEYKEAEPEQELKDYKPKGCC